MVEVTKTELKDIYASVYSAHYSQDTGYLLSVLKKMETLLTISGVDVGRLRRELDGEM
jgi:hypothetical protein